MFIYLLKLKQFQLTTANVIMLLFSATIAKPMNYIMKNQPITVLIRNGTNIDTRRYDTFQSIYIGLESKKQAWKENESP